MLSSHVIKNVGEAGEYYGSSDNYYTKEEGLQQSEWWGKGTAKLHLEGQVNEKQFIALLAGKFETGQQLGKMVEGELKHRPGWDLTLSAPKSISILAYLGGDKRLIQAHREAVYATFSVIEKSTAQARINTSEGIGYQNTGNLVAALFHHDLSRAYDPQLHTHGVVMNMTERKDGVWRSLASQIGRYDEGTNGEINGFIERVRHFNRYFSKIYETELAFRVKQLGYEITTETESGHFEIAGVPRDIIEFYSKRRQEIKKALTEKGLSGGKAAQVATLNTREKKQEIDRAQLKEQWDNELKVSQFDCQKIIELSKKKNQPLVEVPTRSILNAIDHATKNLSVFKTTFSIEELLMESSQYAIRESLPIASLLNGVSTQIKQGILIEIEEVNGKTSLMAKSTLEEEKKLIANLQDNKLRKPLFSLFHLENYLAQHEEINLSHHDHLKMVFGEDKIILLEGNASKQALIEPIVKIAKSADLDIAILSPSLIASRFLAKEVKLKPESFWEQVKSFFINSTPKHYSVMQFLARFDEEKKIKAPDILFVDHAHLLSTHQKSMLIAWNKSHQTKLILLGEKNTLLPIQQGNAIEELTQQGVKTISLSNSLHKEEAHTLMNNLGEHIVTVKESDDRHRAMAMHFVNLSDKDRQHSWLIGENKQSVEELNYHAHGCLKEKNKISKSSYFTVLTPVFLPEGKSLQATSYTKDQMIRFNADYTSLAVRRGEYCRIIKHHHASNRVLLEKADGRIVVWQPDKLAAGKIELFNAKKREMGVGENLFFHRSIRSKHIIKGERLTVFAIHKQTMKLKNADGKSIVIDLSKPYQTHFDYGYAASSHQIAHEKPTYLIAEFPTKSFKTDQRHLLQVLSQPKEAWIYTDDSHSLVKTLEKKTGNRLSAHEILKNVETLKKQVHAFYEVLEKQIVKKSDENQQALTKESIDAVHYAMNHLAEREAGFTHKELMQKALEYAFGKVTQKTLRDVTIAMEKAGILLRGKRGDGTLWTTVEAVNTEREISALAVKDQGKCASIANEAIIKTYCENTMLNKEQINAIKQIALSKDRILAIQGYAGTGKTSMMLKLADVLSAKELLVEAGYHLQGIAPTHKAVRELSSRGIKSQTVDSFLIDMRRIQDNKLSHDFSKTLLIIDEASMVSNRKMLAILDAVHDLNFRQGISTGDINQNPSIEAGKPHELIQRKLDSTVYLKDIQRQKNPILKAAVQAIYQKDVATSFSTLDQSIIEIKDDQNKEGQKTHYQERVKAIAKDFLELQQRGEGVQIIVPSHQDRKAINYEVRLQMNKLAFLKGESHSFTVFSAKDMTGVEKVAAINFKPGQIVRFALSGGPKIKAGEYFAIKQVHQEQNLLSLTKLNGNNQEVIWQIPKRLNTVSHHVELFTQEERDLKIGDRIHWVRTNKKEGLISTDRAEIIGLSSSTITAKRDDNSVFTFDGKDPKYQHWDHAYAITVYGAQGGTYSTVLAFFESYRKKLMNLKNFLVTLTRPENHLRIYTDNKERLQIAIAKNAGDKRSSLEVIGEYPKKRHLSLQSAYSHPAIPNGMTNKRSSQANSMPSFSKYEIERVKEGLNQAAEKIAIELLGKPKLRGSQFLKFGSNQGSLSVTIKGEKQGWWNDFSKGGGGRSMLSFIQKYGQLTKREALEYSAKWLGMGDFRDKNTILKSTQVASRSNKINKKITLEQEKKIGLAQQLAKQSQPLNGTLAEAYLNKHRAIFLETYPDDIRFHPGIYSKLNGKTLPAMLAIARDKNGRIQAVQATYLNKATAQKIPRSEVTLQKQTFGVLQEATVAIHREKNVPTLIAEGTETGLSLLSALKNVNVKITLGKANFKHLDSKNLTEKVIFCLDNDGKKFTEDRLIINSAKRLVDNNKRVSFMQPTALTSTKQDYNDILKQLGSGAIQEDFKHAIPYDDLFSKYPNNLIKHHLGTIKNEPNLLILDKKTEQLSNPYSTISKISQQHEVTKNHIKIKDIEQEI